jgi:hypothetical protein
LLQKQRHGNKLASCKRSLQILCKFEGAGCFLRWHVVFGGATSLAQFWGVGPLLAIDVSALHTLVSAPEQQAKPGTITSHPHAQHGMPALG